MDWASVFFYISAALTIGTPILILMLAYQFFLELASNNKRNPTYFYSVFIFLITAPVLLFLKSYNEFFSLNKGISLFAHKAFIINILILSYFFTKHAKTNLKQSSTFLDNIPLINFLLISVAIFSPQYDPVFTNILMFYKNNWITPIIVIFCITSIVVLARYRTEFKLLQILGTLALLSLLYPSYGFSIGQTLSLLLICLFALDFAAISAENFSIIAIKSVINFFRSKTFFKFVLLFTMMIVVALTITSLSIISITKQALIQSQQKNFFQIAYNLVDETNQFIRRAENLIDFIKKNPKIQAKNEYTRSAFLYDTVRNNTSLDRLIVLNRNAQIMSEASALSLGTLTQGKTPEHYKEAIEKNRKFQSYVAYLKNKIFISIPKTQSGKYQFSVAGYFNLNRTVSILDQFQHAAKLNIDIVDESFYSIIKNKILHKDHPLKKLKPNPNKLQRIIIQNNPYIVAVIKHPKLSIMYYVMQPEAMTLDGVRKGEQNALFMLAISVIVFVILGILIAKIVETPISTIQKGVKKFRQGKLDYKIELKNIDEFGQLAEALNQMSEDLNNLVNVKLKSEQLATISQMAVSLNHEINNPLATMTMGIDILKETIEKSNKELTPVIDSIFRQILKISELVNNISSITEPVIEEYVEGTKMMKINFKTER